MAYVFSSYLLMPKSVNFTYPELSTNTFSGFISLWTWCF